MNGHVADLKSPGFISSCLGFLHTDPFYFCFAYTLVLGGFQDTENYVRPKVNMGCLLFWHCSLNQITC